MVIESVTVDMVNEHSLRDVTLTQAVDDSGATIALTQYRDRGIAILMHIEANRLSCGAFRLAVR